MPTLTRTEAQQRARTLDVHEYVLDLDLTRGDEVVGSTTSVRFSCSEPGTSTFVELRPAALHRVVLNGRELDPASLDGNRVPLPDLAAENELLVVADVPCSRTAEGIHRFVDPEDGAVYVTAHVGVDNAQRVFACFDQPDLKAPLTVSVTAPPEWTVVSNGVATSRADGRWTFATTPRLSPYLLVVVAGPLHTVTSEHRGLSFDLHARRSLAEHLDTEAPEILAITRACFDRYRELFDEPYPFDSYAQAFVPEHFWAAMETPGCVTFNDDMIFRSAVTEAQRRQRGMVIAHEMAHMWFGDLVTMRWWDDVWLSESFAEYMGFSVLSEATDLEGAWTDFAVDSKTWGYDADQRPSTHPVAADPSDVADTESALSVFDGISYSKGAAALRQLVAWLGPEVFVAGVNGYLSRHRFGNAELGDLIDSLTEASGRDVQGWAASWLRTTGVDTLTASVVDGTVVVSQDGTRPHLVDIGLYDAPSEGGSGLVRRALVPVEIVAGRPTVVPFEGAAPRLVVLDDSDLTFAKVRLDEKVWAAVASSLSGLPTSLSRAGVWVSARDMVRDGQLAPADYLAMVRQHLPPETETSVVNAVLKFARAHVVDRYLHPSRRDEGLAVLQATCRDLLSRNESEASSLRLLAFRSLADTARTASEVGELSTWLASGTVPGGPELDDDLRWRLLLRLVVLGVADESSIAAEQRRDPSQRGEVEAARCRSAVPTAAAKAAAWERAFGQEGAAPLSNTLLAATLTGFWQPEHASLVEGYVARWFTDAAALAERGGPSIAEVLGHACFPFPMASSSTVAACEEALARPDLPAGFRRQLVDRLDDVQRAVRTREE